MKTHSFFAASVLAGTATFAMAQGDATADLKKELDALRGDYEKRISQLETRIRELESTPAVEPKKKDDESADEPRVSPNPRKKVTKELGDIDPEPTPKHEKIEAKEFEKSVKKATDKKFDGGTEVRDIAKGLNQENLLSQRIEDVLEGYLDISGYFRAGYGRSNQGGAQQAFGIPDLAKYRLGNEAENYGELAFAKTFYPAGVFAGKGLNENDPVARMTYRMSFYNPYDNYGSSNDTQFASPEVWASLANVIPGMPDAKIWAGNRFYRRHDIHINDFYFWDMSGGGAGIEDVDFAGGKVAFAWIGDGAQSGIDNGFDEPEPTNAADFSKTNYDLRYYDWDFFGGKGEVGLIYSSASSGEDSNGQSAADTDGFALSLVRTDKGFLDPNSLHVMSLQFGTGPAISFTSGFESYGTDTGSFIRDDPNNAWRLRFTDQVVVQPIDQFSIGASMVYQYTDYGTDWPDQQWLSGGVRPIWQINDVFSIAFEGGVDWASTTQGGDGGTLGKLTIAPQVSLGNHFFSRPVLRAFFTYAFWTEGLQGQIAGPDYNNETAGWSWGVQMETWW